MSSPTPIDVLAVDDHVPNLRALEAILDDLGANLVTAQSGDEALRSLLDRDFALVLLDVQMPGLDGFDTAALIRSRDRSRGTPIIFITAYPSGEADVTRGYDLGAVDFLFKPIDARILRSKVAVFLELHRKTEEVRRQAAALRAAAQRESERALAAAKARWEHDRLRDQAELDRMAAEALERKAAELRRSNERLQLLADSASQLLATARASESAGRICEELVRHLGLDFFTFHVAQGDDLALRAFAGVTPSQRERLARVAPPDGLLRRVASEHRKVVWAEGRSSDDEHETSARELGLASVASLPLLADERLLGVLCVGSRSRSACGATELSAIQAVADELALALDHERLLSELRASAESLREADRRKDEFLAMLAHELRNPLAPLGAAIELLRRTGRFDAPQERALDAAGRQLRHLGHLVDDLLDVARITRGKIELRRERTRLLPLLELAIQTAEPLVRARNHRLDCELPAEELWVDVDGTRLAQVVSNLLTNAAKYTAPGGTLRLTAEERGVELVIRVRDDGLGIEPHLLERIFDTFVQVHTTTDRSAGGLGLGLPLVRKLSELHGGTVVARSAGVGHGSEFEVVLPVIAAAPDDGVEAPGSGARVAALPLCQRRILVVDDNDDIRATLRDLLELEGHEVLEAADGLSGVDRIVEDRPEIALVDLGLPGLDGFDVARRVRAHPENGVRLVALSGYGGDETRQKVLACGFDAHLVKPVDLDELFRAIGPRHTDDA